jgi:integrase
MKQLALFSRDDIVTGAVTERHHSDDDSGPLLVMFEAARVAEGAHARSVKREVSQLRSVLREAKMVDPTVTLRTLLADVDLLARCLREPSAMISRTTGRVRLLAVQRCMRVIGPPLGRTPEADLAALDARLPGRRSTSWHTTGTLTAGTSGRSRRRGPTLAAADLRRLVDVAGAGDDAHAVRDRTLVALLCFTGLRPEEVVRLRWENLSTELTADGRYGLAAAVGRNGRCIRLLVPEPAAAEIEALAGSIGRPIEELSGPVLCARGVPDRPLSYRAARDVLQGAFRRAGLPPIDSTALRAACGHWLRSQGLSDHEVANVLGLARVRSVDRLLRQHTALAAQRTVREVLGRSSS